jgi:P27 family predicted phage terminase small subunit
MPGKIKPTHLHLIEGTFNVTRHRKRANEPKPATSLDQPPEWFTSEHLDVWDYGLRHSPPGLLKGVDAGVYTVWVCASVNHRQAAMELAKLGRTGLLTKTGAKQVTDAHGRTTLSGGNWIQSPLVGVMNRAACIMLKAASELGFSPVSRARIAIEGGNAASPEDRFFTP